MVSPPLPRQASSRKFWLIASITSVAIHLLLFGVYSWLQQNQIQVDDSQAAYIPIELWSDPLPTPVTESPPLAESSQADLPEPSPRESQTPVTNTPQPAVTPPEIPQATIRDPTPPTPQVPKIKESPPEPTPFPATVQVPATKVPEETPLERVTPNPANPSSREATGILVILGTLELANRDRDIPDQPARPLQVSQEFTTTDYLTPLNITLEQDLILQVSILIDQNGRAELISENIEIRGGSLSQDLVIQLTGNILKQLRFEPTYMEGQPVAQVYSLSLTIRPIRPVSNSSF